MCPATRPGTLKPPRISKPDRARGWMVRPSGERCDATGGIYKLGRLQFASIERSRNELVDDFLRFAMVLRRQRKEGNTKANGDHAERATPLSPARTSFSAPRSV